MARHFAAVVLLLMVIALAPLQAQERTTQARVSTPLGFEETPAADGEVAGYRARANGYTLTLTPQDATIAVGHDRNAALRIRLADALVPGLTGIDALPGKIFYITPNQTGQPSGHSTYRRVKYSRVYPGIDLEYYGTQHQLEFDFVVAANADPKTIRLSFDGADRLSLEKNGELTIALAGEKVVLNRPVIYQERDGARRPIAGRYELAGRGTHEVRFKLGPYDRSLPLVIDPAIEYAGYLGSAGDERLVAIDTNTAGDLFVFGSTRDRLTFPGRDQIGRNGDVQEHCFLSKLDASGTTLLYSVIFLDTATLSGGAMCDAMSVSSSGGANVVYQSVDGVFVKMLRTIDGDSNGISFTTVLLPGLEGFLPAPAVEEAGGYFHVIGGCYNERFPTPSPYPLPGGYRTVPFAGNCDSLDEWSGIGRSESVLIKYSDDGTIVYGTFLGDSDQTDAISLAVDEAGIAYIGGRTRAAELPATAGAFQTKCSDPAGECNDAVLIKIDTTVAGHESWQYATYLGGAGADSITAIHAADGFITVAGSTTSADFPVRHPSVEPPYTIDLGVGAAFATRFYLENSPGAQRPFTVSLLTNRNADDRVRLTVRADRGFAIAGMTEHPAIPLDQTFFFAVPAPGEAYPYLQVFSADGGALRFSTLLEDRTLRDPHVAADGLDSIYAVMTAIAGDRAVGTPFQPQIAGGSDAFVMKINGLAVPNTPPTVAVLSQGFAANAQSIAGAFVQVFANVGDPDGDALTVTFTTPSSVQTIEVPAGQTFAPATMQFPIGASTFTVTVSDRRGGVASATGNVNVLGVVSPTSDAGATVSPRMLLDNQYPFLDAAFEPKVHITFPSVTNDGVTTINARSDAVPPLPVGSQMGSPPYYYQIGSTVQSGSYTVCVDLAGMTFAAALSQAKLLVNNGSGWVDTNAALIGTRLCGESGTLGTFAVLHPPVESTRAITVAGSGHYVGAIDGPGGDPRDDFVDGLPPLDSAIALGQGGLAFDRARNLLYMTTLTDVRRVDLASNVLDTVAGNGQVGEFVNDPGDGMAGIVAESGVDARSTPVTNPNQLALDAAGNLIIAEYCKVRRLDRATGIITTIAGDGFCRWRGDGGPATEASFNGSMAIAFDAAGNLLVGEQGRIRRIGIDGMVRTVAGDGQSSLVPGPAVTSGMRQPVRFAFAPDGDLYFVQIDEMLVRISAGPDGLIDGGPGEELSVINACALNGPCPDAPFGGDGGPVTTAVFQGLLSVAVEANGDVLIGDYLDHRARRIAAGADGAVTGAADEIVSTAMGFSPNGRARTGYGAYYASEDYALSSHATGVWDILIDPRGGSFLAIGGREQVRHLGPIQPDAPSPNDLAITASAPAEIHALTPFAYSVTLASLGPLAVSSATMTATLPQGLEFMSASAPECGADGATVSCHFSNFAAGQVTGLQIMVRPALAGSFTTTFTVSTPDGDGNPSNDSIAVTRSSSLMISELIHISDVVQPQPSVMLPVITETIAVTDTVQPQPSVMLPTIVETIAVVDTVQPQPSVMLPVITENIVVTDVPSVTIAEPPDTTAPVVTPPPAITVAATEAGGARGNIPTSASSRAIASFIAGGSAADDRDPAPVRLAPQAVISSSLVVIDNSTLFPIGDTTVTFAYRDASGNAGSASSVVRVSPSNGGVVGGAGVVIVATTSAGEPVPVTVIFDIVRQPGLLTADVLDPPPPLPEGFKLLTPVFEVSTTAIFDGVVTVCFQGADFKSGDAMLHFDGRAWIDVTSMIAPREVCGRATSLSPFVVMRPSSIDTAAPVVTPPASIVIAAADADGVRPSASPALMAFLAGATAVDAVDPSPVSLPATIGETQITSSTLFPLGSTSTVTFSFRDASGNTGSATATVRVIVGRPSIDVRVLQTGAVAKKTRFVDLEFSNGGDGYARHVSLLLAVPLALDGSGLIKMTSPKLPVNIGNLAPGEHRIVRVVIEVPTQVKRVSLTEGGLLFNVINQVGVFLKSQVVTVP